MIGRYLAVCGEFGAGELDAEYRRAGEAARRRLEQKNPAARRTSLAALCLLRRAVTERFGCSDYTLDYTENGQPRLGFCFVSIAHAGDTVACALSERPVGIDIEPMREIKPRPRYLLFTAAENAFVNQEPARLSERFLWCWTRKEAFVKLHGGVLADAAALDTRSSTPGYTFSTEVSSNTVISLCERTV